MTSPANATVEPNAEISENKTVEVKQSTTVTTIQRIYKEDNDDLIVRDPTNRRSFINRSAYAKLHRSLSAGNKRHSVDNLKGRFENLVKQNSEPANTKVRSQNEEKCQTSEVAKETVPSEVKEESTKKPEEKKESETEEISGETKFTPASFGYPKTAKLVPPLIKPKPVIRNKAPAPKDENSNLVRNKSESSDVEEFSIILRHSASEESIDKIANELSSFTMDGKSKERKRANSFKKLFMGSLFGKDKKKKEEDRNRLKYADNIVYNDNMRNESNFSRYSPHRRTAPVQSVPVNKYNEQSKNEQEVHEERVKELEQKYAKLHVNRFNQIRQNFVEEKTQDYLPMDNNSKKKPSISDYISVPVNKYIDTSSTASTESEKPNGLVARDTPPRAQETYQNFKLVKPKASIPINSERSLPNPYQNEKVSPRTIERNLNKSNSKDYPDKPNFSPVSQEDTYGTVFDSLEYSASRSGEIKPINLKSPLNSPKSPSLESTKLRLPPNREIYDLQPRVRSPIPINKVSTEKIIATELLKNSRSPTPPKRTVTKNPEKTEEVIMSKPPISPKPLQRKSSPVNQIQSDKIVTNAVVHAPRRAQTPLDNRTYSNVQNNYRASTPVDLRMSAALKLSPQKEDIRRSVEEYYWKELKKLKEEEDSKLYSMQMINSYYDESARVRRSRSLSPSSHKTGRRNLSLPRDGRGQSSYTEYFRLPPQQSIPEERALIFEQRVNRQLAYDQNFVRNTPERRSVDSLQRPIFRRGSLTKQEVYESQPYNKRVSFSNSQAPQQAWPTRNGYTQSPPQRRLERADSELEDEVFLRSPPPEPVYGTRYSYQNEPVYSNRVLEQFRSQQYDPRRQQMTYGQVAYQIGPRRLSMDNIPRQDIYVARSQLSRRPLPNVPAEDHQQYRQFQQYPDGSQLSLQHNPVYSSRQSVTDANYGQRQVTVRNKFCDIYGQIHDSPQSGVVMGRLRDPKMAPRRSYTDPNPEGFVRGSRLAASAHDLGRRHRDPRHENDRTPANYDKRPLPPPPPTRKATRPPQISDTESGSDASEIQRIMQSRGKSKKRGFFGK